MSTVTAVNNPSPARAWLRALELTGPIAKSPDRILPAVIQDLADKFEDVPALLSDAESLTYRELAIRSNRYARWALSQGLAEGGIVCLLMPNRPEYMAIWLGITSIGGVVSLLNTNLSGRSLAHCINVAGPKHIIVDAELIGPFTTAVPAVTGQAKVWVDGGSTRDEFQRIDDEIETYPGGQLTAAERHSPSLYDTALYIYTSGTTGLPKAAKVSHFRLMQWSHWFAGMMDTGPADRMYNCLPMYHSTGGVIATGALLVGGGSVVIREKFSASEFWHDIARWDCTLFQYIGELCRYLLQATPALETKHRIRMCCGNGLRAEIWKEFQNRFRIPGIVEFYAATEGTFSLFNVDGQPGAMGRIPSFLVHRFTAALVKFDIEKGQPIRDEQGFCIRCTPGESGEALGRIPADPRNTAARFEGYTSREHSEQKVLRDVFERGDAWFRTGDLMRKDEKGYFYFVDRIGDTFRWKGENVATSEVSEAICTFPGIRGANVYGVTVPGAEGRAGMAVLMVDGEMDLTAFRMHLNDCLPAYARPLFLRLRNEIEVTATFKYTKNDLVREGYDPEATPDVIYFNHPELNLFVRLDKPLFERIRTGQVRI
jgi:fatty-acyl-CoA synthase